MSQETEDEAQSRDTAVQMVENVSMHSDIYILIYQAFIECLVVVMVANGGKWSEMCLERFIVKMRCEKN